MLTSIVNASNHRKYLSLSDQKCTAQSTLINLDPNEYSQGLCYYPFAVNLDRCVGSCYTLNNLFDKISVANKAKDLNLRVLIMIAGLNKLKTLPKHISRKCKCKFDGKKCNSTQKWNDNKGCCECENLKEHHVF